MYSNKLVISLLGISVSICLAVVITVLPEAQEPTQTRFDVPEEMLNKMCGSRSGQQAALGNWKEHISVHPLTFGAKLTLANKALFGKAKTLKQPIQQLMYLYGYKPEVIWQKWKGDFRDDETSLVVSNPKIDSFLEAAHSDPRYAIVRKASADTSLWKAPQYSGYSVQPIQPFEEIIQNLDEHDQGTIVKYVDPASSWSDPDFRSKARIWRDYLCVLLDISEKGGMVALTQEYGASKPEMIYYTMTKIGMITRQEIPATIQQVNEGSSDISLDRPDSAP